MVESGKPLLLALAWRSILLYDLIMPQNSLLPHDDVVYLSCISGFEIDSE